MSTERTAGWRVGTKVRRNVYRGDEPIFVAATEELAAEVVAGMNAAQAEELAALRELRDACEKVSAVASRVGTACPNKEHRPLRFPLCAACQLFARIEEMSAALAQAARKQGGTDGK